MTIIADFNDPEANARLRGTLHKQRAPSFTDAFVHRGMWVVDCPYPSCANAESVDLGQRTMHCTECRYIATINWPIDADAIMAVLSLRPVSNTRHWAPAGHRQAVSCGFPEGQTVADLIAENEENL